MADATLGLTGALAPPAGLTMARTARLVLFSTLVWFSAALFIRFVGPRGGFDGWRGMLIYLLTIPATIPLNRRALKIAGLTMRFMPTVIAVTTATATLEDGVAMRLVPRLYGGDPAIIEAGAIWLLWAIGVASALSVFVPAIRQKP